MRTASPRRETLSKSSGTAVAAVCVLRNAPRRARWSLAGPEQAGVNDAVSVYLPFFWLSCSVVAATPNVSLVALAVCVPGLNATARPASASPVASFSVALSAMG